MSTQGGVWRALERGRDIGCDAVQIFVKNNMQWRGKPHAEADVKRYKQKRKPFKARCVFGHTGYLINLGAQPGPNRDNSLKSLIQEIEIATPLGLPFLVMHPGAHLGAGEDVAIKQIVAGLDETFAATRSSRVRVAIENTAGQGTCLGYRMAHLAEIFDRVNNPERLAVCLDTAHFFAAGYDIRAPKGWDNAIRELASLIGIRQIVAFHLNDSKTDLGSRVDRHAHIGQGKIGLGGFRHIVNDPRFKNHPACLETPKSEDLREDVMNLNTLRSLVETRETA